MGKSDTERLIAIAQELHSHLPPDPALRAKTLESLLVEKGLLDSKAVDAWIETYVEKVGPKNGAKLVAKAWLDPAYKARLLENGTEVMHEEGFRGRQTPHLVVVENGPDVHNLVVCTLCSCYPFAVLGLPPAWYKSIEYRARAVRDPRGVLEEFGLTLPEETEVRVWDSTSEVRYMVLPERPAGSEGMDEAALAALVSRNAMIGTAKARVPGEAA